MQELSALESCRFELDRLLAGLFRVEGSGLSMVHSCADQAENSSQT